MPQTRTGGPKKGAAYVGGLIATLAIAVISGAVGAWINDKYFSDLEHDGFAYLLANDEGSRVYLALQTVADDLPAHTLLDLHARKDDADTAFEHRRWDEAREQYVSIERTIAEACLNVRPRKCGELPFTDEAPFPLYVEPPG